MRKTQLFFTTIIFSIVLNCCQSNEQQSQHDNKDIEIMVYVPNEETAKKIAEAIWFPIYGEDIYNKGPFVVSSSDSVWIVKGTLPEGMKGGVPYIEIRKIDGKVLKVTHGK